MLSRVLPYFLALLALTFGFAPAGAAHPISVVDTFVYVTREKVVASMDVFVEDLFLFHNLKPNNQDFLEPDVIRDGIEKHRKFLLDRFVVRDAAGERLTGKAVEVKEFAMKPEGIPLAELMMHKLTFVLEYPLSEPPEFLTFSQHLVDEAILVPAEMKLRVKQENAGTPYQSALTHTPQTVRFSWDNPPLSPDASQAEWEKWYQQQSEETLGITSYSSVYSFLYIEDFEVRHEILVPLLTLEASVLIARADDAFLEIAEQDLARKQIEAYFLAGNPIEIDGVAVKPVVQRVDFYGVDFKDFARPAERRRVSMASARVGIILSYSTKGTPSSVKLTWDRFNKYIWSVNVIVYAFEQVSKVTLSRIGNENTYQWQNPGRPALPPLSQVDLNLPPRPMLSVPIVSALCLLALPCCAWAARRGGGSMRSLLLLLTIFAVLAAAAWPIARWRVPNPLVSPPRLADEQVATVFATLLKNTYRAFDYRDEHDVYDALAKSVDGPLLRDLYLKVLGGLQMQEQGGAVSRVREVKIASGEREPLPAPAAGQPTPDDRGFQYRCRWTVNGTVEHWGHIHARTNEYDALFAVEPRDNAWKITGLEVLGEQRLKFETKLRGL